MRHTVKLILVSCFSKMEFNTAARAAPVEALFKTSPLNCAEDFVAYCKYLYACGAMGGELFAGLSAVRTILRKNASEIQRLKEELKQCSSGGQLSPEEEVEIAAIEEMSSAVAALEHTRKRNEYTLSQNLNNKETCRILTEV